MQLFGIIQKLTYPDRGYIRESTVDTVNDTNITATTAAHSATQNISESESVYVHTLVACFSLCTGSYDGVSC